MTYDSLLYAQVTQNNGLAGVTALKSTHVVSGDTQKLKDAFGDPFLIGFGAVSLTKPQASALACEQRDGGSVIYGNAGRDFYAHYMKELRRQPMNMVKGDVITGQISNTNVSEASIVAMDIVYSQAQLPKMPTSQKTYKKWHNDKITITVANALTFDDAAVSLETLLTNKFKWIDKNKKYELVATIPNVSSPAGGIASIQSLPGAWEGKAPGLIINPLSTVNFAPGTSGYCYVPEPIPMDPLAWPTLGMCGLTAVEVSFGVLFGEL